MLGIAIKVFGTYLLSWALGPLAEYTNRTYFGLFGAPKRSSQENFTQKGCSLHLRVIDCYIRPEFLLELGCLVWLQCIGLQPWGVYALRG